MKKFFVIIAVLLFTSCSAGCTSNASYAVAETFSEDDIVYSSPITDHGEGVFYIAIGGDPGKFVAEILAKNPGMEVSVLASRNRDVGYTSGWCLILKPCKGYVPDNVTMEQSPFFIQEY